MPQVFTITNQQSVFTATLVRSGALTVSKSTNSFSASVINPGFTATLIQNILTVSDTTQTNVTITPVVASVFTGTVVENVYGVNQTVFNVTATNETVDVTINKPTSPIVITYNPTVVEHVYDGQPVYTTSSVQFKNLTLGNTSTFTFPADDGEFGYALLTDGNGQLFWALAGGGGGIGSWNLNDDLTTNGFKIKSGSNLVDLQLLGGNGRIRLESSGTFIQHTATNGIVQLANQDVGLILGATQANLAVGSTLLSLNSATTSTLYTNHDFNFDARDVKITNRTLRITSPITIKGDVDIIDNGTIEARDVSARLQVFAPRAFFNTLTSLDAAFIDVPPLRFSDGSIIYGAGGLSSGPLSLNGNLYLNENIIKSNESQGTLKLQQGNTKINLANTFTDIISEGASVRLDASSAYGTLFRASANEVIISATTSTLFGDVWFERAIRFGDVAFGGDLDDLRDVQLSSPTAGQVLKYNGSKWVNGSDSGGTGTGVDSIIAGTGIAVSTGTRDITITNIGVQTLTATNGLVVDKSTGSVAISIGNLPIREGDGGAIVVDTSTFGTTKISIDYVELFDHIVPGPGIYKEVNEQNKTITISTTGTGFEVLSDDLYTVGFDIRGENNPLNIRAGQTYIGTETRQSIISMPVNDDLRIYSDYGIVIDTADDTPVQVNSQFIVSHRNGLSRISTDPTGLMRLNDTIIAITATNRISLNNSTITPTSVKLQAEPNNAYIEVQASTSTIAGNTVVIASTGTTKIGSDIYNSRLGVQEISNWNGTGPFTAIKGVQYPDLSVQLTSYLGSLNFGQLGSPATRPEEFILQLLPVDFGTIASPSAYSYDAGTLG